MEKLVEATLNAINLVKEPYDATNIKYGKYQSIYMAPTGNVKDAMSPYKGVKRVLAVGGVGAFGFEAGINDSEVIDMFDCNELQRHFFELIKASIMVLSYEQFMDYFTLETQSERMAPSEFRNLLSPILLILVEDYLPVDTRMFFEQLYYRFSNIQMIHSSLYRYAHAIYRKYLIRFASMYDEESYYKLQKILREKTCKISYKEASLIDLPKKYDGPYDLVVLGNILQYYKKIPSLDTPFAVDVFIKKELSKLLAPDGVIQVNYGFQISTICLKDCLGLPYPENDFVSSPFGKEFLKRQSKIDIMPNLLRKGGYDFTIFEGVETFDGTPSENCVLTYKKK